MESIRSLIEKLVESLKNAAAQQQESKIVIAIREKYQELPPLGQRLTLWTSLGLVAALVLYFPASNLMDAMDQSSQFNERRQSLRELLKVVRDAAGAPTMRQVPAEPALRSQVEGQMNQFGIKPDQIKGQPGNLPPAFSKLATSQLGYKLERVTIRQMVDVVFAIEQSDPATKVTTLDMTADSKDPHYYTATLNIVSFGPKITPVSGGIGEAIKRQGLGKKEDEGAL